MERYHDKVIIELSGHDHMPDVRYHNGSVYADSSLLSSENNVTSKNYEISFSKPKHYHNLVIAPGATAIDG
jgi:ribosomal protein S12